jgi:hypothetical protein
MNQITLNIINCGAIVAVIATVISFSNLFTPIREKLPYLKGLFYCPLCLSYWISLPITLLLSEIKYCFLVILISNIMTLLIVLLYNQINIFENEEK